MNILEDILYMLVSLIPHSISSWPEEMKHISPFYTFFASIVYIHNLSICKMLICGPVLTVWSPYHIIDKSQYFINDIVY